MRQYTHIDEIIADNRRRGYHFFDRNTMRSFDSRVLSKIYGGRFFITSEQFHGYFSDTSPRRYTVRECVDGQINTIGEFNVLTKHEAQKLAKELASQPEKQENTTV